MISLNCSGTYLLLENGFVLPIFVICNGVNDCPGHQDEVDCASYTCPGYYRCRDSRVCLHHQHMCDGVNQCPEKDDEFFCNLVCPENCTCNGLAYTCHLPFRADLYRQVRYLDASNSGMSPADLSHNTMLVYLNLAACRLTKLHNLTFVNLHVLDATNNRINGITVEQLISMLNLRTLILSGNPLTTKSIFHDASLSAAKISLTFLDVSRSNLAMVNSVTFIAFPNVEHLNISHNPIVSIEKGGLETLRSLRLLDVRKCPLVHFPHRVFAEQNILHTVFADNYKLCCSANLPDGFNENNCHAPEDDVSSCNALLRSDVFRVFLSVDAFFSLIGNAISLAVRLFFNKNVRKSSFAVFIINLCISDFLMGVYLAIIGVADRLYMDSYLWEEVIWRHSIPCQMAGFLSLLSSETSAIIISLVTLDRFLVIRFPFSSVRFGPTSATAACITTWITGCILAAIPLVHRNWDFYSQTGICIPLPTTQLEFAGRDYIFGIIIVFNFVLFLIIASGQTSIYLSILSNQMSDGSSTRKSQDIKVARHLITVAVSDFLCWFPIGLLGLLASEGVAIPGVINIIMAIIVLPLNAALNPFLYNLSIVLDKRNKAKEKQLARELMAELDEHMSRNAVVK